jgi:hypothetical protein
MLAALSVGKTLRNHYSEKDLEEALTILNEAAEKLENLNSKLERDTQ